ncbi:NADH-quinone oxidoreductase subunit A [Acuticoccus sediminis]|uniref:NADH-quinone oxidoreductase subunit n=1 Tax=Acuticoccus sediminis TaxID=2184697 RepID=A0A8B2NHC5_9HYPH|nr:NADH-quinone oxidoreductase subunit A [Acuticoccus sediminis]RAH96222.1 NADH-quinone oxidoreductase subunit A [Acuticoccus sediminis]
MTTLLAVLGLTGLSLALVLGSRKALGGHDSPWPQRAPFLGGGSPATHAWQRYHVRFYTMTLVFIAFEMEMMFMYPWAVVFVEEGLKALAEMGMFLAILSIGILYGWREGVFRWQ